MPTESRPSATRLAVHYLYWFARGFYEGVRILWLAFWGLYQLALGLLLVALVYGALRLDDYLCWSRIRALRHANPATTAFIESEKRRLRSLDSVDAVRPPAPQRRRGHALAAAPADREPRALDWEWTPLDSIPELVREVAIIAEDGKFFEHEGFDLEQIEYALVANHQAGRHARGASTITQQVAKNLFLSREKELSRKLREAALTYELEQYLPKERILEIYLNVAQFDEGAFGVKAGARRRFGKSLRELTPEESIKLVCLLPAPLKWSPARPTGPYLAHMRMVTRNLAAFRGFAKQLDPEDPQWQARAYEALAQQDMEDRWKLLRARPRSEGPDADSAGEGDEPDSSAGHGVDLNAVLPALHALPGARKTF